MQSADLTSDTILLLVPVPLSTQPDLITWYQAPITIIPGNFATLGDITSAFTPVIVPALANGVAFFANEKDVKAFTLAAQLKEPDSRARQGRFHSRCHGKTAWLGWQSSSAVGAGPAVWRWD